jgi:hypothetical protein
LEFDKLEFHHLTFRAQQLLFELRLNYWQRLYRSVEACGSDLDSKILFFLYQIFSRFLTFGAGSSAAAFAIM